MNITNSLAKWILLIPLHVLACVSSTHFVIYPGVCCLLFYFLLLETYSLQSIKYKSVWQQWTPFWSIMKQGPTAMISGSSTKFSFLFKYYKYSELPLYIMGKDIISYTGYVAHHSYSLFQTTVKRDHSSKRVNKADVLLSFQNETLLFLAWFQ